MINVLEERKSKELRQHVLHSPERITIFPDRGAHLGWIGEISRFIGSKGGSLYFGIERYKGDFEFFTANSKEEYALAFMTHLAPLEIVFIGVDWKICISSYPEYEYSASLEYSIRLYGVAQIICKNHPLIPVRGGAGLND